MVASKKRELEKLNLIGQKFSFISQKGNNVEGIIGKVLNDIQFLSSEGIEYRFSQIQHPFDLVMKLIEVDNKVVLQLRQDRMNRLVFENELYEKYGHEYWYNVYLEYCMKCGYELPMFKELLKSYSYDMVLDFPTMSGGDMRTTFIPLSLDINGIDYYFDEDYDTEVDFIAGYNKDMVTIQIQEGFVYIKLDNKPIGFKVDGYLWNTYFEKYSRDNKKFEKFNELQQIILTNSIKSW